MTPEEQAPKHILKELGFVVQQMGDGLEGKGTLTPHMHVPGAGRLRTGILAAWSDTLTGLLAAVAMGGRVPVTVSLAVDLNRPAPAEGQITARARVVKKGRSVFVNEADFSVDGPGSSPAEPFATATGTFMLSPDESLRVPDNLSIGMPAPEKLLDVPLAERAGCERLEPGVAVLHRAEDGLNSSRTINGGLIALAAEEAALSLAPGRTLASLYLHYLQPARVGPLVARAVSAHGVGRVELRDAGAGERLSVLATTREFS